MVILAKEVAAVAHQFIFIDEVGFNLTKRQKRGKNIIASMTLLKSLASTMGTSQCLQITHHGVIHHHAILGPYNTAHLIILIMRDTIQNRLIPPD